MRGRNLFIVLFSIVLIWPGGRAFGFELAQPVDCTIGSDCIIQNYVDVDTSAGWQDYNCGSLTYDGHKGTDFRIRDYQAMREGVAVRAAADGIVLGVRNNIEDRRSGEDYDQYLKGATGRECGNGLVLVHDEGYQTQYCHMRKGSVAVTVGDHVKQGDFLGYVGMSGKTQFPHLHISLRQNNRVISPFAGPCGISGTNLWKDELSYIATHLLKYGFTDIAPNLDSIEEGLHYELTADSKNLLFWANLVGVRQGDIQEITITRPDGRILARNTQTLNDSRVNWLSYIGRKRPPDGWPKGTYRARYVLKRATDIVIDREASLVME